MNPALPGAHCVYLLLGKNRHLYIGCTADLERRFNEHKTGKVFSTKRYLPVKLIYWEVYSSKVDAFNREKALKQYGSAFTKLKLRLRDTLQGGRAG